MFGQTSPQVLLKRKKILFKLKLAYALLKNKNSEEIRRVSIN